ncbi:MAG: hypothetical protein AB3K77_12510 [Methanosarcinaceae archaeon]
MGDISTCLVGSPDGWSTVFIPPGWVTTSGQRRSLRAYSRH